MATPVELAASLLVGSRSLADIVAENSEVAAFLRKFNAVAAVPNPEALGVAREEFANLRSRLAFDVVYGPTFADRQKAQEAVDACGVIQSQIIDVLAVGNPEKGTKNLEIFFTTVYRPDFWKDKYGTSNWTELDPSQKTSVIWDYIEHYVIMAQTTGTSPWMPVDIIHKEVDGLPDKASIELLISSLRLQGGEHEGFADRLEIDIYRIQKIFRIGHALQNIQKSSTALADFFKDKNNLFSTEEMRDLAKMGMGYTNPPTSIRFAQAFQITHALNRPEWKKVHLRKHPGVYDYPVASEFAWWPQTAGKNTETRMQIRRAVGGLSADPTLQALCAIPDPNEKLTRIKEYLGPKIRTMKAVAASKSAPGETWYSANPVEQAAAVKEAGDGALFEMLATNFVELNSLAAEYDAGKPVPADAEISSEGLPILDDIFGFSATLVSTKNRHSAFYRKKLRKGGGEGTPGPEVSDGWFPRTGYSILEYFTCDAPPKAGVLESQRETLLQALMRINSSNDFQEIFSRNAFGDMAETSQGTMEMFYKLYDKYIISLGISWKSIKHFVPGSNGSAVEFDPEVGKKVQQMARDVYYLLVRGQYEGVIILQNPKKKPEDFATKVEYAQYTAVERAYRNAPNKATFLAGLGGDRVIFEARYKRLNSVPSPDYRVYDGFQDVINDANYVRFKSRFIDQMVHVPRHADGKLFSQVELVKVDKFAAEIFYPSDGLPVDYYAAIQKLYLGRLIIADILGQGQKDDIDWNDARALLGILVRDCWEHEIHSYTAQIRRTMAGTRGQVHSYEGYGKFTYEEATALLEMAGVPTGVLARAKSFYKGVVAKENK